MISRKKITANLLLSVVLILLLASCYKEVFLPDVNSKKYNYYLAFDKIQVGIDQTERFMLCPVESLKSGSWTVDIFAEPIVITSIDGTPVDENGTYTFESVEFDRVYQVEVKRPDGIHVYYSLEFTPLPVFQIYTESEIQKEPKIPAWVTVSRGDAIETVIYGYMGIEYRGGSAAWKPKKSFGIEFWEDMYENGHNSYSFFGLIPDDDWILDAMYVDKSRMRKALSFKLWKDMQEDRLPDLPVRTTSSQGGFVEVFIHGEYSGLYHMSERIDRKRLDLTRSETNLEGLIYKSEDWQVTTMYIEMTELTHGLEWGGWELKYPKHMSNVAWDPLYNYLDFAINSSDEDFEEHIFDYLDIDNTVDFFLFLNAIKALDNYGKNVIMVRYDAESRFLFIPWDLDATWGRTWLAEFSSEEVILKNNFFDRLLELNPDNFNQRLIDRWEELKLTYFDTGYVNLLIDEYYTHLITSGAIRRENIRWPEGDLTLDWEISYMKEWYSLRQEWLNDYFRDLPTE